jgi:hypothetical protein
LGGLKRFYDFLFSCRQSRLHHMEVHPIDPTHGLAPAGLEQSFGHPGIPYTGSVFRGHTAG